MKRRNKFSFERKKSENYTICTPLYECIIIDQAETTFFKLQQYKPLLNGFVTLVMSSLFGLMTKKKSAHSLKVFGRQVSPNIKFTREANKEKFFF